MNFWMIEVWKSSVIWLYFINIDIIVSRFNEIVFFKIFGINVIVRILFNIGIDDWDDFEILLV